MSNTLKRAAELLRHQADRLAPLTNVQAVIDHRAELARIAAELERMAQVEPVAWQKGWKPVPVEPVENQWSGLAREIMMGFDMGAKSPDGLMMHLNRTGETIPGWLRDELSLHYGQGVMTKGDRVVLIYRAMIEDAPTATSTTPQEPVNQQLLAALKSMVEIHDEPSWFAGKYGKALDVAIYDQSVKIDGALESSRAAISAAEAAQKGGV